MAIGAQGTQLQREDPATPGTYTTVAEVRNIGGPGLSVDTSDVTSHDSGPWREFISTLIDPGEVSLDLNFLPDDPTQTALLDDLQARRVGTWRLLFPNGATWGFPALVTGFEPSSPHDGELSASATLKVTGQPDFAAA
ncbi:MAG TPA: phage tail tube protein [Actinomycetota bacterium]|nr:phage tail tube protein [Actinomycetota bacterium]